MAHDRSQIETSIEDLSLRLDGIERRLDRLESQSREAAEMDAVDGAPAGAEEERPRRKTAAVAETVDAAEEREPRRTMGSAVPLFGRALVVLGGAFLIRAITESGVLPDKAGVTLGIAYGVFWLFMADRDGRARRDGATYHGLVAALILFPLVWESTVRFHFLAPPFSALVLTAATVLALVVAARQNLRALAWGFVLGAAGLSVALASLTRAPFPFGACMIFLGLSSLWHGYLSGGTALARITAGFADLWILMLTGVTLLAPDVAGASAPGAFGLSILQLGLVVIYLGSFASRTLLKERAITTGEIIQAAAVIAIGFGGAIAVAHRHDSSSTLVDISSFVLGAGGYAVAFAFIGPRAGRGANFFFYSSLALVLTAVALVQFLHGPALSAGLSLCAAGAAVLGFLRRRSTLSLHAAAYVTLAAITSGLLQGASSALFGIHVAGAGSGPVPVAVAGVAALAAWLAPPWDVHSGRRWAFLPGLTALAVVAAGCGGAVVALLSAAGIADRGPHFILILRAAVLAATAVGLAALTGIPRFHDVRWLVYAVLISAGLRMVLQDILTRNSAVIFASLALYGTALILAPRLLRGHRVGQSPDDPAGGDRRQ